MGALTRPQSSGPPGGAEFNAKGYHPPVLAYPIQCNGCDLCGLYCPDFAIFALRYQNPEYVGKPAPAKAGAVEEVVR